MSLAPQAPAEGHIYEGLRPPDQGPENRDRPTRPKLKLWDRIKFLLLFTTVFFILVWASMAELSPILPFSDAVRIQMQERMWLLVLAGIEVVRQIHFLVSEHWSGYHRFWTNFVFGGSERFAHRRLSDWTRYRIARVIKWAVFLGLVIVVIGAVMDISPVLAIFRLPSILWNAMPFIFQMAFAFFFIAFQFIGLFWFLSRGGVDTYFPDDIKTRFKDVWGQDHVLARVKENIVYLERPQEIEAKGGYVPGGLLLWGPPGTGKTLMAEAVAGETGKPYVFVDPGAFTNMFMGVGILKVKSLFRKLRKLALRYGGVIVFFDEADALGNRGALAQQGPGFPRGMTPAPFRSAMCHGYNYLSPESQWLLARDEWQANRPDPELAPRRNRFVMGGAGMGGGGMGTLQALLTELSGLKKPRGFVNRYVRRILGMRPKPPPKYRILVMMATNLPEALDEALLRPGRIDRIYKVGYPSKAGRVRTYEGYLDKVRHELTDEDIDKLATITPYATGATIKDLVNEALITAIRNGREIITWKDVIKAKQFKDLGPPEDVEYIERERHAVAVHEACHAVIAYRTRRHLEIDLATIEKGSDYLGMVAAIPPEDQFTRWKSEYQADIYVSLASLAGERLFFEGDSSSGVSGDLESATSVASYMEGFWGMGSTVSSYSTAKRLEVGAPGGGQAGKRAKGQNPEADLKHALADRIEHNLADLLERVAQLLRENRREVLVLAHALERHKTLTGDDVGAILEARVGPTVDGRPYGMASFFKEIEAYHRAAVVAHNSHSKIMLSLPLAPETDSSGSPWAAPATLLPAAAPNGAHGTEQPAATPGFPMPAPQPIAPVPPAAPLPPFAAPAPQPAPPGPQTPEANGPEQPPAPPEAEAERDPDPPHWEWRRPQD
jgi:ATP-dependent Zn protease